MMVIVNVVTEIMKRMGGKITPTFLDIEKWYNREKDRINKRLQH